MMDPTEEKPKSQSEMFEEQSHDSFFAHIEEPKEPEPEEAPAKTEDEE